MRFFISSNIKNNAPLYVSVLLFLLFSLTYWVSGWFYYGYKFGLTYGSMFSYFFTDPQFPERLPLGKLLEDIHVQLFLYVIFLLVLSSLFLHKCMRDKVKLALVSVSFLSGIGEVLSGFAVYFFGPLFIYPKLFLFYLFQVSTGSMLALTLKLYASREKEKPPERGILYSLVFIFALSTILFTALNFFLFANKLGLTPASITQYYLGNPERFIRPKSFMGIMEVFGPHTVAMGVYLVGLVHFSFFTNVKRKVLLSVSVLSLAFIDNLSSLLIRFFSPHFSIVKLLSFLGLSSLMVYISVLVMVSIIRHRAKTMLLI